MTDTQAPDVVVTEADRELFLALQLYSASSAVDVARGMADRSRNMQKIAAFRLATQSTMQARIGKLEAALRPFARAWKHWSEMKRLAPESEGAQAGPKGFVIPSEFATASATLSNIGGETR